VGAHPSHRITVVPHLVMRSNSDLILERLRVDLEAPNGRSASLPD
jgi:hypothetical protein